MLVSVTLAHELAVVVVVVVAAAAVSVESASSCLHFCCYFSFAKDGFHEAAVQVKSVY
jgi:hypothetical protein